MGKCKEKSYPSVLNWAKNTSYQQIPSDRISKRIAFILKLNPSLPKKKRLLSPKKPIYWWSHAKPLVCLSIYTFSPISQESHLREKVATSKSIVFLSISLVLKFWRPNISNFTENTAIGMKYSRQFSWENIPLFPPLVKFPRCLWPPWFL